MPLRFTEADKWKQEWFQELNTWQKLMYLFMQDNCDNAGFMEVNPRYNAFLMEMDQEQYIQVFESLSDFYIKSTNGKRIWLKSFLKDQKNQPLNKVNKAHQQIINIISEKEVDFAENIP